MTTTADKGKRISTMKSDAELIALCDYASETSGLNGSDRYVRNQEFSRVFNPIVVRSLIERAVAAERENEELRLAILGGEDVPGLAASLPLQQVLDAHYQNLADARAYHELDLADQRKELTAKAKTACVIHSQYPITTDFDRGYDKARKDAAQAVVRALSTEAQS